MGYIIAYFIIGLLVWSFILTLSIVENGKCEEDFKKLRYVALISVAWPYVILKL